MNAGYMRYMRELVSMTRKSSIAFIGNEAHFKHEALLATLRHHRKGTDIDEERLSGSKKMRWTSVDELLNEYPMIGRYREIIVEDLNQVKDYEKLGSWLKSPTEGVRLLATFDEEIKKLPETLPFDVVVVCNSPSADSKEFLKYIEFCLEGTGKTLTASAFETAKDLYANNLHLMRMELVKAAIYADNRSEITPEDLVLTTVVYPTSKVFDLVEALIARDMISSFRILHDLLAQNIGLSLVIHLLTQRLQNLADAIRAIGKGERLKDYMIRKKIPLFQYDQLAVGLRTLKDIHIKKYFDVLCESEYNLKLNQQEDRQTHVAEMMILNLCR